MDIDKIIHVYRYDSQIMIYIVYAIIMIIWVQLNPYDCIEHSQLNNKQ